jgi:signal transduction histidine kinase
MRPRHTILVVDDEPDVVKSIQDLLRFDYKVLGATRATEGLRLLSEQPVHVVLTDQRMPEMTGVDFLRHLRDTHPDMVRLLVTGYADIRAVIDAINEGNVYRYVTKPWEPEELQAVVREAVERYDLIAERRRLMEELKGKNEELSRTNAELSRANELKAAFIQVASHELRTPLTILMGLTRLAGTSAGTQQPLRSFLDRIEQAAKRLQHLVDQLVTMLQAGKFERPLDRQPTDLAPLLRQAADDVRPFIELRNQSLSVDVPADLGSADVEASKVRDSLNHLLLNAIKFTPDGGQVDLVAERARADGASGTGGANGEAIRIRVTDTGSGIDPASQEKLFEPFFTGFDVSHHSSGRFEHGRRGLGLGLSVVKAFVEMHGGTVRVDTEVGRGTTFTITLPVHAPPGVSPAEALVRNTATAPGSVETAPATS